MQRAPDFSQADQVIQKALEQEVFPAACVLVGRREKVLFRRAYGRLSIEEDAGLCNEQTRFDLASVSKPLAVGMLALRAMESGKLCLWDQPGTRVQYSCTGFILLGQLLECLYGLPLNELALQEVFWPLKMKNTSYLPAGGNIASTEMQDDGFCLTGVVHDENARFLGGVSGNAGVFSTMDDLALFVQMLAAEGELPDGSRYLCPATVRLSMQNRTPGMAQGRGLGFALPWYENGYTGDLFPKETIGHTGFTGTSFSYDPTTGLYLIFLTNRVCPSREGTAIFRVRRLLHNAVYAAASV